MFFFYEFRINKVVSFNGYSIHFSSDENSDTNFHSSFFLLPYFKGKAPLQQMYYVLVLIF